MDKDWLGAAPEQGAPSYHGATFEEEDRSGGHPIIATAVCVVLLLATATAPASVTPATGALALAYVFGVALFGAILWLIAYAITIRHASKGWKIGSFIGVVLVAALVGLIKLAAIPTVQKEDMRTSAREMERVLASGDDLSVRMKGEGGPLSRMIAASTNGIVEDAARFDREARQAGVEQLLSFNGLTRSSPVLRNCDKVAALAPLARELGGRMDTHLAAARRIGERAEAAGELPRGSIESFEQGARRNRSDYERQWTLNAELAEEAAGLCRLLGSRNWQMSGQQINFRSGADSAAFNRAITRIRTISAEQQRLSGEGEAQARRSIQDLRRMAR